MKKIYITLVFTVCIGQLAIAQWATNGNNINTTNTGNVGINTTVPATRLSVISSANATSTPDFLNSITIGALNANASSKHLGQLGFSSYDVDFTSPKIVAYISGEATETYTGDNNSGSAMKFYTTANGADIASERMVINSAGNIGMGTDVPTSLLHIKGSAATCITLDRRMTSSNVNILFKDYNHSIYAGMDINGGFTIGNEANLLNGSVLTVQSTGNVGIGTSSPGDKLSVNGNIRAKEVKVEMSNWPDFVFAKDYVLPTLKETEKHIKEEGHLPGIPSAAEVEKNGIELGDMNKKLLQKIEELTLYLIEQQKELDLVKKEMKIFKGE